MIQQPTENTGCNKPTSTCRVIRNTAFDFHTANKDKNMLQFFLKFFTSLHYKRAIIRFRRIGTIYDNHLLKWYIKTIVGRFVVIFSQSM